MSIQTNKKHMNSTEAATSINIKEQKRNRAIREEEFLLKFWRLSSPILVHEDILTPGDCQSIRIVTDLLKLIYDPYISGLALNTDAFN